MLELSPISAIVAVTLESLPVRLWTTDLKFAASVRTNWVVMIRTFTEFLPFFVIKKKKKKREKLGNLLLRGWLFVFFVFLVLFMKVWFIYLLSIGKKEDEGSGLKSLLTWEDREWFKTRNVDAGMHDQIKFQPWNPRANKKWKIFLKLSRSWVLLADLVHGSKVRKVLVSSSRKTEEEDFSRELGSKTPGTF